MLHPVHRVDPINLRICCRRANLALILVSSVTKNIPLYSQKLMGWTAPRFDNGLKGPRWYARPSTTEKRGSDMQVTTVGSIWKRTCSSFTAAKGRAVLRKQLGRGRLLGFLANLPHCLVVPEACASAHYWAREIEKLGSSLLNR